MARFQQLSSSLLKIETLGSLGHTRLITYFPYLLTHFFLQPLRS